MVYGQGIPGVPPLVKMRRHYRVDESGCWLWTSSMMRNGYGQWFVVINGKREQCAHRASYVLHKGSIPQGYDLDHLCRVRSCVNPDHLEPVTRRENLMRSEGFSAVNASKTHCVNGHEFTPENTYHPPKHPEKRNCRACIRQRSANRVRAAKQHAKGPGPCADRLAS